MPSASASTPVVRLSSPGEIVAALPAVCGFPPRESIVALSLRGPRKRLGLTVRLDLPDEQPRHEKGAADLLTARLAGDGAGTVAVVVLSEHGRRPGLVGKLTQALAEVNIGVREALHVQDGRWTSYVCTQPCCPADGTPVRASAAVEQHAAESVLRGRAVLPSRAALTASLAPAAEPRARRASERALDDWLEAISRHGVDGVRAASVARFRGALDAIRAGEAAGPAVPDLEAACALAVSLHDVRVRDEVVTWAVAHEEEMVTLLTAVVRQIPAGDDAPACTMLAWVSYARGQGAVASVALERALGSDPAYSLALLLQQALDGGLDPDEIRGLLRPPANRQARRAKKRRR